MDALPEPLDDHGGPEETPVERAAYLMQRAAREYRDTARLVTDPTKAAPFVAFAVKLESSAADIVRLVDGSAAGASERVQEARDEYNRVVCANYEACGGGNDTTEDAAFDALCSAVAACYTPDKQGA
jgi:hypothetical protein